MRNTRGWLRHYDELSLIAAMLLLVSAMARPTIKVDRDIQSHLFFVDITQSMNVEDMKLHGLPASRLAYTRYLLKEVVKGMPCGSRVGLGIFAKANAILLYAPIEVCANFDVLQDSFDHLDWRMAPHGSSLVRFGLQSMASMEKTLVAPTNLVFFTDGEEAPPLNEITKTSLKNWQSGRDWLLVGVGGGKPMPIPKFNARNEIVGYWSIYSIKIEPAAVVSEESTGARDDSIATEPREYYLSKLDEPYMQDLAKEIGAQYVRAGNVEDLTLILRQQKPALQYRADFRLDWILGLGALFCLVSGYLLVQPRKIP